MSAMEKLLVTALKSFDLDVEGIKKEVTKRIGQFEENVNAVRGALIAIHARTVRNELMLETLLKHHGLEIPPTANTGTNNGSGNSVPQIPAIAANG